MRTALVASLLLSHAVIAASLYGSGSTFVYPFVSLAAYYYKAAHVTYQGVGSGAGIANLLNHLTDFAGSDVPIPKERYAPLLFEGKQVVHVPVVAGSVVVIYNVPELGNKVLKLDGEVLAEIYMGKIKYWDDPRIKALQDPEVAAKLPHKPIIAVHRSDASGTTAVFTKYLAKSSAEWNAKIGSHLVINWPVDKVGRGIGAPKNQGVAATVSKTSYSIGYVEYAYAVQAKLPTAALKNAEGNFVLPTPETISAATAGAAKRWICVLHAPYFYADSLVLAPGKDSYPIVATPYIIFFRDSPKLKQIVDFVKYLLSDELQKASIKMGYAPLSKSFRQQLLAELDQLLRR
ncbi:phosphate ABC transporter substrate-binding protein PstS [Ignicoccus hospitalis]|uniref:Phosphate-binding protein n=1 Tax=Ignicoccus hospitalis (strain KIN4/I / DSM 18386 / JCM 14125) TaxID=453591 RepID=A8AB53_IGNH4|nr:phosphate ABC transporter substrate-binding protein PstS [Ignicoccus hospitalis]ABU82155.1 phosphate ABC transporter, periplasmic phosphate-binding protein [Ignicoccus hospitalis KIN4/I]HIH91113.1 phosphate ABC transporter substrate-binding protein PstS [Desulfurococcaceae archaeon]